MYDGTLKFDTKLEESGFKTGMDNLGSIASGGMDGIKSLFSSAMDAIGQVVSKGLDSAFQFGKETVQTGMDFSSALSQIGATLGYSVDVLHDSTTQAYQDMQTLTEKAEEMGAKTAFTATQAAEGLNILAMNGYTAAESVGMIDSVLNMASAGSLGMADSAKYIAVAMKGFTNESDNFADSAEASRYYADMISKGATMAATSVDELGRAFSGSSALANTFGQSSKEMEVALLRLAEQGTVAEEATTSLKNILMNIYTPSSQAKEVFDQIGGFSGFDDSGKEKDLNTAADELNQMLLTYANGNKEIYDSMLNDIFSSRGATAFAKMMASSEEKVQQFYEGLENASGSASQQAAAQLDNLTGDIQLFTSALDGLRISLFKSVDAPFRQAVQKATGYLDKLNEEFKKNSWNGLGTFLGSFFADGLKEISSYIPQALQNARNFTKAFLKGLSVKKTSLAKTASKIVLTFIQSGADALSDNFSILIPTATEGFLTVIEELTKPENLSKTTDAGIQLLTAVGEGFGKSSGILIDKIPAITENLKQSFSEHHDELQSAGEAILSGIADGLGVPKNWNDVNAKLTEGFQNIDFAEITKNLSKMIIGVTDSAGNFIDGLDWSVIGGSIGEALNGVDFNGILSSMLGLMTTAVKNSPELLKGLANEIDAETAAQLATIGVNLLIGKEMIGALVTYVTSETALASLAPAMGTLFSKCAPAIGAAIVGWDIGTLIYNANKESIDEGMAKIIDDAKNQLYTLKALWDWTFNNKSGLSVQQLYRNIALDATASGVGFQSDQYRKMVADWGNEDIYEAFGNGNGMNFNAFEDSVKEKLDSVKWLINDTVNSEEVKQSGQKFSETFAAGIIGSTAIEDAMHGKTNINALFGETDTSSAEQSGRDMMQLFADGIKENAYLPENEIKAFADFGQKNLGFSVPEEGALSEADTWMPDMMQLLANGIKNNSYLVEDNITSLTSEIKNNITDVVDSAFNWGWDMLVNFNNGVVDAFNSVIHTVSNVASSIKSYLGFSEPEKGALSDFHTFAPDMMSLFAEGIRQKQKLVLMQAETLAENLSGIFQNPVEIGTAVLSDNLQLPDFKPETQKFKIDTSENYEITFETAEFPEIPEFQNSAVIFDVPEMPEMQNPEISLKVPEMPEFPEFETAEITFRIPEMPVLENPEISLNSPELPEIQNPEIAFSVPEIAFDVPELPELNLILPEIPEFESHEIKLETPSIPELYLSSPELSEIESPEIGFSVPEIAFDVPELPELGTSEIAFQLPEIPELNLISPDVPELESPAISLKIPNIQEICFASPELPEIQNPEISFDVPELIFSTPEFPEMPELSLVSPDIPEFENLELNFNSPEVPEIQVPEIPEISLISPDMPELENPEISLEIPDMPEIYFSSPEIPELESPEITLISPEMPAVPDVNVPELPEISPAEIGLKLVKLPSEAFTGPELPEIKNPEITLNSPEIPESIQILIDERTLQALQNAELSVMQNSAKTSPVTEMINNHYHTINQNTVQNPTAEKKPPELTIYSTIEMNEQEFGSAVKKVILDENSMSGGWFI